MKENYKIREALTFDDILLVPQYSGILPKDVNISCKLTNKIKLNIPLLSAAMDTVTEYKMGISLAREGGIGVIHKNLSIDKQAEQVDLVKRSESGMILNPITISKDKTIKDALKIMEKFSISGIPVVNDEKLIGIITNRDIRFEDDYTILISERMTKKNLITVQEGISLQKAKKILQQHRIEKLLVVDKNGKLSGLITVKDILKKQSYPNASLDKHGRLICGAAVGVEKNTLDRVGALLDASVDLIFIDTAHGHSVSVLNQIDMIKKEYSSCEIVVGNIATASAAEALIDHGADVLKVGIGAGSSCTTRIVAGVGVPQLTSVMDVYEFANKKNIKIISDGGMRYSGDIAKSLAAGAGCVMLGSLFAGTDESPGEMILWEGRSYKSYRGMGSVAAMRLGSKDRYFQSKSDNKKLVPEGIEGIVPFKGPVGDTVHQLVGGIKSSMGYCGAKNIKEFPSKAEFIKITSSGIIESHPHDIKITKESPNYHKPR
jgi:IMP dehydrogenase